MSEFNAYVVIHGRNSSNKTAVDYVANIVYGSPKVEAVAIGEHFVAIVQYPMINGENKPVAEHTRDRMGSFPHGASLTYSEDSALQEFGTWVRHYAPGTIVGLEEAS